MAAKRDVTHLTDISKGLAEADGTFQRKASTFRSFIEKGGEFEPEKGTHVPVSRSALKALQR